MSLVFFYISMNSNYHFIYMQSSKLKKKKIDMKSMNKSLKRKISDESLKTPVKHRKSDISNTSVNSDKSLHKKKNPESLSRG